MRTSRILLTLALVLPGPAGAQSTFFGTDEALVFVPASDIGSNYAGFNAFGTPSLNEYGDIVLRVLEGSLDKILVIDHSAQKAGTNDGNTPPVLAWSSGSSLSSFPCINDARSVAILSTSSTQTLRRLDRNVGGGYTQTILAKADFFQNPNPFSFLSPIADLHGGSAPSVAFYGDFDPVIGAYEYAVFDADTEVTSPTFSPEKVATTASGFSTIDAYVAASEQNDHVVFLGTGSAGFGIYADGPGGAIATSANGFASVGSRPSINSDGTVAFQGNQSGGGDAIWLKLAGEASPRPAGSVGPLLAPGPAFGSLPVAPSASFARVAVNDLNQVAYLGVDENGFASVYSTNLGATRKLVSVDDQLVFGSYASTITSLSLHDSLSRRGFVTALALTSDGGKHVLRFNRSYTQGRTLDSPVDPGYRTRPYLLREVTNSGFPQCYVSPKTGKTVCPTIANSGCNLTSTAAVLSFYGHNASPGELQDWLLAKYANAPAELKGNYIDDGVRANNFSEDFVLEYTRELAGSAGHGTTEVDYKRIHDNSGGTSNLQKIIDQLRNREVVKLRVPSGKAPLSMGYIQYGHYVVVYGLRDPSQLDALITTADLLVHDPGHDAIVTLQDYGALGYDQHMPGWLEDNGRVYVYSRVPTPSLLINAFPGAGPAPAPSGAPTLSASVAPVELVVTDPLGRRVGLDPSLGTLSEIPGASYYEESTFYELDEAAAPLDPVWGDLDSVQRLIVDSPLAGDYTLEVIGTGTGPYEIAVSGSGGFSVAAHTITGSTIPGQRDVYSLAGFETYCTAGTSAAGCRATLQATGTPSATAPSGFDLIAQTVEGSKDGLFFFGSNGRQANPWGNGTSFQCVVPPVKRAALLTGTGTSGACDGTFTDDLNARWCPTCPKPHHNPGAGSLVQAQLWYRDPQSTSNKTTSLSNAVEFSVAP